MRKIAFTLVAAVAAIGLTGCMTNQGTVSKESVGTVTGGVVGGILASQVFHGDGKVAGVIGGTLLGGLLGQQIGKYMDRQDAFNMQNAIISTPMNSEATWTNQRRGTTYVVRPVKQRYEARTHRYCREYQTMVTVGGKTQKAYGQACREPDGTWQIKG